MSENGKAWDDLPIKGPFLRPQNAAEYLGLSVGGLYRLAKNGRLPKPISLGSRVSVFCRPHLDAVIAKRAAEMGGV